MERAEFRFDFGGDSRMIYRALLPESAETFSKSVATLSIEGGELRLSVAAEDITALRAALNTWLRLIRVACETVRIRES